MTKATKAPRKGAVKKKPPNKWNSFFKPLSNVSPFVKFGVKGFAGSGKSYLLAVLAIGLHKQIKSKKPVVVFDTEGRFYALKDLFEAAGVPVVMRQSRTLADFKETYKACAEGYTDILLVDSITHIWETFCQNYMDWKTEQARKRNPNSKRITKIRFPDWAYLKDEWKKVFSSHLVFAKFHILFAGRAGYEYSHQVDDDGRMTELVKSGVKMKVETGTEYEPDMVVLCERHEEVLDKRKKIWRTATVLKDRFRLLDGAQFTNAKYKDFEPTILKTLSGTYEKPVEALKDDFSDLEGSSDSYFKNRDIALEEIKGHLQKLGLGTGAADKAILSRMLEQAFGTMSWSAIESMQVEYLQQQAGTLEAFVQSWDSYREEKTKKKEKFAKDDMLDVLKEHFPDLL